MPTIQEMREHLPKDEEFTDEQVERIRNDLDALANILFDMWLIKRKRKL